jgi:hypothetical protein
VEAASVPITRLAATNNRGVDFQAFAALEIVFMVRTPITMVADCPRTPRMPIAPMRCSRQFLGSRQ